MVSFVEDVARWNDVVVQAAPSGLGHDQRMVRDDQFGGAGSADGVFDETPAPVRAGGMDAFTPPVGQRGDQVAAEQFRQPAGQIAALHVAVVGRHCPTRDQAQRHHGLVHKPGGGGVDRVFQVQQAQVVFAPLAHHDTATAFRRVWDQTLQLIVDLALQVTGKGADPDRPFVLLGPHAGGGEVAQRLASASARFGQNHVWVTPGFARREGGSGGAGIIALPRPLFGMRTQHLGEAGTGLGVGHRVG